MTEAQAKRVFSSLMQKARTVRLSERELRQLTEARQLLRRAKRPAMNPGLRKLSNKQLNDLQKRLASTRKFGAKSSISLKVVEAEMRRRIDAGTWKIPYYPLQNPGSFQRLGRALEIRYKREVGHTPGFYKHEIESRRAGLYTIPPGWVYVSGKSILITEKPPKVR